MSLPESDRSQSRRLLSALADGDATPGEATRAFDAWREQEDTRASWHCYQLIGDVMRSDDLAKPPARDESFLQALRARLADEPVVLAPVEAPAALPAPAVEQPAVANARAGGRMGGRWQGPVAMAAGFLAVIGGLQVMRAPSGPAAAGPVALAGAPASSSAVVAAAAPAPALAAVPQTQATAAQLAPYLAAHRQSTMNATFQMPGADIRNASLVQPAP